MDSNDLALLLHSRGASETRRGLLATLSGGLLAATGWLVNLDTAEARKNHRRHKRRKKRKTAQPSLPPASGPTVSVSATCARPPEDSGLSANLVDVRFAQTFTALVSGAVVRAELPISKDLASAEDYVLQLATVDATGVPTNSVLATASVAGATVPVSVSTLSFLFANPAAVVAGTQYALILSRPGSDDLLWSGHRGDTCSGRAFKSSKLTAPFEETIPDLDLSFTTFVSS